MKRLLRVLGVVSATLLVLVSLVGFAHTRAGRPLLAWLAASAGCPASLDGVDVQTVEAYRTQRLLLRAGDAQAKSTPALGFELGVTTRSDVGTWARQRKLECESVRDGSVLQCRNVVQPGEVTIVDLHLQFDARARLVAVDVQREPVCSQVAVARVSQLHAALEREVGSATQKRGRLEAAYLEAGRFRSAATEYRYRNYLAKVSATHMGPKGISVREQYQWAGRG